MQIGPVQIDKPKVDGHVMNVRVSLVVHGLHYLIRYYLLSHVDPIQYHQIAERYLEDIQSNAQQKIFSHKNPRTNVKSVIEEAETALIFLEILEQENESRDARKT